MIKRYLEECNEKESVRSVRSVRAWLDLLPLNNDDNKEFVIMMEAEIEVEEEEGENNG